MATATSTTDKVTGGGASPANSDEIRANIRATRAEMAGTVDEIQSNLSPQRVQETTDRVINQVKEAALDVANQVTERVTHTVRGATIGRVEKMADSMKETTRGAGASVIETIKANPIPAVMIGAGLAWLFMNKSGGSSDARSAGNGQFVSGQSYYPNYPNRDFRSEARTSAPSQMAQMGSRVSEMATNVQEKAGDVASSVSDTAESVKHKAEDMAGQAQERMGELGGRMQNQAQRVMHGSQSMLEENPLVAGALAVALGLAAGFLLPETRRENELMGPTRDRLINQAGEAAQDTLGKVQRVASETMHVAKDTVREAAKNEGLTPVSNGHATGEPGKSA